MLHFFQSLKVFPHALDVGQGLLWELSSVWSLPGIEKEGREYDLRRLMQTRKVASGGEALPLAASRSEARGYFSLSHSLRSFSLPPSLPAGVERCGKGPFLAGKGFASGEGEGREQRGNESEKTVGDLRWFSHGGGGRIIINFPFSSAAPLFITALLSLLPDLALFFPNLPSAGSQ